MVKNVGLGVVGLGFVIFIFSMISIIPAGHVGVVDTFGVISEKPLTSGVNFVNPLSNIHEMSIKTKEIKEAMQVPTKEGLTVNLEVSVLYSLVPAKAPEMYKTVGENYEEIILIPQIRSIVRGVTASSEAKTLYSADRGTLEQSIRVDLEKIVTQRGVFIEGTPLRGITLPPSLSASIEEKQKSDQENQRMEFVLQKEEKEAERKRIEAKGIQDFQTIVAKGISPELLEWKGIEATEMLAKSPNSKIVIIGSGKNGLPIILNGN
ncbi:prohibitin family protein [Candidatus Parcubacteria bacterium]|nr:MAG: prohibitin family protein [Candidatus Parcubacteria bacterium]